jgi:hypothetical protein
MEASVLSLDAAPSRARAASIPWYCHAMLLSATSIIAGLLWDISWHTTIGRDTFWTPAHMAIYLGGVLAGVSCGFLVLKTTFAGTAEERASSVRVWGMRGPLGAWLAIWGAFAMITSAPFDDWWHNAYGLDVKILSPPHVVLALGMMGVIFGAVLFVLARQNRGDAGDRWFRGAYVYCAGILVAMVAILVTEYTFPNNQHGSFFYLIGCGLFPFALTALGGGSRLRWPATSVAACYMGVMLATAWVLQLFPATPKLAPIYHPVDHMVPIGFPLLLVVPAFALDLLARRLRGRNDWLLAAAMAAAFVATFFVTQWYFSQFLLSAAADNPIFMGNRTWSYWDRLGSWTHEYWDVAEQPVTLVTIAISFALAFVSARLGLSRGRWMREVVR